MIVSDATPFGAEARRAVLGMAAMRLGRSLDAAAESGRELDTAARRLAPRLGDSERKHLDDAAQLVQHARESLAAADAIIRRVADGRPETAPSVSERAGADSYYEFAGYAGG